MCSSSGRTWISNDSSPFNASITAEHRTYVALPFELSLMTFTRCRHALISVSPIFSSRSLIDFVPAVVQQRRVPLPLIAQDESTFANSFARTSKATSSSAGLPGDFGGVGSGTDEAFRRGELVAAGGGLAGEPNEDLFAFTSLRCLNVAVSAREIPLFWGEESLDALSMVRRCNLSSLARCILSHNFDTSRG